MFARYRWVATSLIGTGLILLMPGAVRAGELPKSFTLGQYVPGDYWMYVHVAHNPEADFVCRYWDRVFAGLMDCGVGEELQKVFLNVMNQDERAQFTAFCTRASELVRGVRWGDLVSREFVFAERFGGPLPVPDLMFLSRHPPETQAANVAGLKAILDELASLSEEVTVVEEKIDGANVWSLQIVNAPVTFHLFSKDDVVGLAMGRRGLQDTLGLLAGRNPQSAIIYAPRFRQALAEVPSPEDEVAFFDIQAIFGCLTSIPSSAFSGEDCAPGGATTAGAPEEAERVRSLFATLFGHFDVFDYAITTMETTGRQQRTHGICRLKQDYKKKPFGRVLAGSEPIARFDQFVPVDAKGFSVSSGVNWAELYHAVLEILKDVPEGDKVIAAMDSIQAKLGVNLEEDVFSWISGETVSFTVEPAMAAPFGGDDGVYMIRLKNSKVAMQKIDAALNAIQGRLQGAGQAPLVITPATGVHAEGFRDVTHPYVMMFVRLTMGVANDWLIVGTSESAVNKCLDTAAGKCNTVADNPRFKAEGIIPQGPVVGASFTDLSTWGSDWAGVLAMLGVAGGFIPSEPGAEAPIETIRAVFTALGRLVPVFQSIDFYSSTSTVTTFDGTTWKTETVLTYKPEPAPKPEEAAIKSASPAAAR
jgi:hypothetical protein